MKKVVSASLVAALLATSAPAVFAADQDGTSKETSNLQVKVEVKGKSAATTDTTTDSSADATTEAKAKLVLSDVQLKKQLIELRQELKHATEITAELKAKYEKLVADLENQADKRTALEVQLELLQKTYVKGDRKPFEKLGQLLEATGSTEVKTFVDGKLVQSDVAPFIQNGRALVPVRAISSALKADVQWDAKTRTVIIKRGDRTITLYLDKKVAIVNGKTVTLDIAPIVKKGRTFLPLRFVSEQLKAEVAWQAKGKIVIIDDIQPPAEPAEETNTASETTETAEQK